MSREDIRLKLLRMVSGQVRSYIADHPDHFAPYAIPTAPSSLAKRIAHELVSKGIDFSPALIAKTEYRRPAKPHKTSFAVVKKKRRLH